MPTCLGRIADLFWIYVLHRLEDYASRLMFSFVYFGICRLEKPFGQDVFCISFLLYLNCKTCKDA